MRNTLLPLLAAAALTASVPALAEEAKKENAPVAPAAPAAKGEAAPAKETAGGDVEEDARIKGKVVETFNGGGYTYFLVESNGTKKWVAVPEMKGKVGEEMEFQPGIEMGNFTSRALNRTFERIVFSGGVVASASSSSSSSDGFLKEKAHAGMGMAKEAPKKAAPAASAPIKVEKAFGPNAYTVEELYAKRASLNEKEVVVAGKVVKVSNKIMGKNWIHIQDGTGSAEKGTNNLVVTSQETLQQGDVVTVRGTFYNDKDFGGGYRYQAIIEKAKLVK